MLYDLNTNTHNEVHYEKLALFASSINCFGMANAR